MFAENSMLMFAAFGVASSLMLLIWMLLSGRSTVSARIDDVSLADDRPTYQPRQSKLAQSALPKVGQMLMPEDASRLTRVKTRTLQAGFYQKHATAVFLGVKFILMVVPVVVGFFLSTLGMMTMTNGILYGAIVGLAGNVLPGMWLDREKRLRQTSIRRALPDALDVIIVCLEGGLSLPASFDRVADELQSAHPLLAAEMGILKREIQLGRTTGEALRQFADRFDVEELRSLASVITQAERFGASVVKAMRVHADTLRLKRYQYAEGQAQKAPVKLIFPTVLCIFPALYIVLMGPALMQVFKMLNNM